MDDLKRNASGYYDPTAYKALKGVMNEMEVKRGDIFFIENNYRTDYPSGIQNEHRPAIIVSNDTGNKFSNVVEVVFLTSQDKKPLPTHCTVLCRVPSTALCEQITTIHKDRIGDFIRTCTDKEMKAVNECIRISLGLSDLETLTPAAPVAAVASEDMIRLSAERDTYKRLYEQLLDKITG